MPSLKSLIRIRPSPMKFILSAILLLPLTATAQVCTDKGPNIILLTLDGVRNQEFFRGTGMLLERKLPR